MKEWFDGSRKTRASIRFRSSSRKIPQGRVRNIEVRIKVKDENVFPEREGAGFILCIQSRWSQNRVSIERIWDNPANTWVLFSPEKEGAYRVRVETPGVSRKNRLLLPDFLQIWMLTRITISLKRSRSSTGGKWVAKGDDLLKEIESLWRQKSEPIHRREACSPLGQGVCFDSYPVFSGVRMVPSKKMGNGIRGRCERVKELRF